MTLNPDGALGRENLRQARVAKSSRRCQRADIGRSEGEFLHFLHGVDRSGAGRVLGVVAGFRGGRGFCRYRRIVRGEWAFRWVSSEVGGKCGTDLQSVWCGRGGLKVRATLGILRTLRTLRRIRERGFGRSVEHVEQTGRADSANSANYAQSSARETFGRRGVDRIFGMETPEGVDDDLVVEQMVFG